MIILSSFVPVSRTVRVREGFHLAMAAHQRERLGGGRAPRRPATARNASNLSHYGQTNFVILLPRVDLVPAFTHVMLAEDGLCLGCGEDP